MLVKLINTTHWAGRIYRAGTVISLPDDVLEYVEDGSDSNGSEPFLKRIKTKGKESHNE